MIIVVDTNVFVSACLGSRLCAEVIQTCLRGENLPLMGAALLAEHEDVLRRDTVFNRCRLDASERDDLLDIYLSRCRWTRVYYRWRPNLRDEGDNHVIELAVAGGAAVIVTRNIADFGGAELLFPGLLVRSPDAFLQEKSP